MEIKILEATDNIQQYLECVSSLNNVGVSLSSVDDIKEILSVRPSNVLTFVGIVGGQVVATSSIIMERKLRYRQLCCHIEDVATHPSHRGKGYGKEIIEYCILVAKKNNCYKIKLNCNNSLINFYEKLGFKNSGQHMIYEKL